MTTNRTDPANIALAVFWAMFDLRCPEEQQIEVEGCWHNCGASYSAGGSAHRADNFAVNVYDAGKVEITYSDKLKEGRTPEEAIWKSSKNDDQYRDRQAKYRAELTRLRAGGRIDPAIAVPVADDYPQCRSRAFFFAAHGSHSALDSYECGFNGQSVIVGHTGATVGPDGWCEIFVGSVTAAASSMEGALAMWASMSRRDRDQMLCGFSAEIARLRAGGEIDPAPAP